MTMPLLASRQGFDLGREALKGLDRSPDTARGVGCARATWATRTQPKMEQA